METDEKHFDLRLFCFAYIIPFLIQVITILFSYKNYYIEIDEFLHLICIKEALIDPKFLLQPWGKPGYEIIAILFLLIGNDFSKLLAIRIMNCFFSAGTCYFLCRVLMLHNYSRTESVIGSYFCLMSYVFSIYSISAMTEPLGAFFVIISYYFYAKRAYNKCALSLSYGFLVRPEIGILIVIIGLLLLKEKKIKAIILIGVFPAIWIVLMLIYNINPLMIITNYDIINKIEFSFWEPNTNLLGIWSILYYPSLYKTILGMFLSIYFIVGLINRIYTRRISFIYDGYLIFYFIFQVILLFLETGSTWQTRYFIITIPICAIICLDGVKFLKEKIVRLIFHIVIRQTGFLSRHPDFKKFSAYTISFLLVLLPTINMISSQYSNITRSFPTSNEIQVEAGEFLQSNFDLRFQIVYCPLLGPGQISLILQYLYHPYLYMDLKIFNRSSDEIITNYTCLLFNGVFEGNVDFRDLSSIPKSGDIIIWNRIDHEKSYFNPKYVQNSSYRILFERLTSTDHLIIYQKI